MFIVILYMVGLIGIIPLYHTLRRGCILNLYHKSIVNISHMLLESNQHLLAVFFQIQLRHMTECMAASEGFEPPDPVRGRFFSKEV